MAIIERSVTGEKVNTTLKRVVFPCEVCGEDINLSEKDPTIRENGVTTRGDGETFKVWHIECRTKNQS